MTQGHRDMNDDMLVAAMKLCMRSGMSAADSINREWLREQREMGRTTTAIATQLGISPQTLKRVILQLDLKRVDTRPIKFPQLRDPEWLTHKLERMTARELADEIGCSIALVHTAAMTLPYRRGDR